MDACWALDLSEVEASEDSGGDCSGSGSGYVWVDLGGDCAYGLL